MLQDAFGKAGKGSQQEGWFNAEQIGEEKEKLNGGKVSNEGLKDKRLPPVLSPIFSASKLHTLPVFNTGVHSSGKPWLPPSTCQGMRAG